MSISKEALKLLEAACSVHDGTIFNTTDLSGTHILVQMDITLLRHKKDVKLPDLKKD